MKFEEAMFILQHGSSEGEQKYLLAVKAIGYYIKQLREENDTLKTEIMAVKSGSDVLKICKLEEENKELKRLLKIAVEDLALCTRSCIGINCDHCHFISNLEERGCKWKHAEEAMKILEDNNV